MMDYLILLMFIWILQGNTHNLENDTTVFNNCLDNYSTYFYVKTVNITNSTTNTKYICSNTSECLKQFCSIINDPTIGEICFTSVPKQKQKYFNITTNNDSSKNVLWASQTFLLFEMFFKIILWGIFFIMISLSCCLSVVDVVCDL
jgi:hypothetical protein